MPADRIPPHAYFVVSAVFHYLGPAFAVLLFAELRPPTVAWLRIAAAAAVFAAWRRPWRLWPALDRVQRRYVLALALDLAAMNVLFYLAIARLPLATVGTIEFLGPITLAALGLRGRRNVAAVLLAALGVGLLSQVRLVADPLGFALAFGNCALFVGYVMVGKRIAGPGGTGVDRLALAMLLAAVVAAPVGIGGAAVAVHRPELLAAAAGVGICSSVIPYLCDQLALARLPRASFALLLALLPATATLIGVLVLAQSPRPVELCAIGLVITGVAVHRAAPSPAPTGRTPPRTRPIVAATKLAHVDDAVAAVGVTLSTVEISRREEPYRPHRILGHD